MSTRPIFARRERRPKQSAGTKIENRKWRIFARAKIGRGDKAIEERPQPHEILEYRALVRKIIISEKAAEFYKQGYSIRQVSKLTGLPRSSIDASIKHFGATPRPSARDFKKALRRETGASFGTVPYGYIRHRGKLVPHPVEMDVVTLALELRSKGMGYCAIARDLKARGIKPRGAGKWDHSSVRSILKRHNNER